MNRRRQAAAAMVLVIGVWASVGVAADPAGPGGAAHGSVSHSASGGMPAVPERAVWVVPMLIVVGLMFAGALAAGMVYGAHMPDPDPHDAHGGDSHGHGGADHDAAAHGGHGGGGH